MMMTVCKLNHFKACERSEQVQVFLARGGAKRFVLHQRPSLASLDQVEDHSGGQNKAVFRAEPPGSPLPEMLHPHELEIIEEQNEADNEDQLDSSTSAKTAAEVPKENETVEEPRRDKTEEITSSGDVTRT